jgi:Ca2+-binding EF-hand superfamily protein
MQKSQRKSNLRKEMQNFSKSWFWLSCMAAISAISIQAVYAQPPSPARSAPANVGNVPVANVLQRLGAKLERGCSAKEFDGYSSHFDRTDPDRDGKHTRAEYVDKGGYMTPQARAGIFRAADGNADGVVTKAEYVLNRIITDEAKAIVQGMDEDKDGLVEQAEFIKHAAKLLSDLKLAEQVYVALDANADGGIPIPEYLQVWGQWARAGQKSAEERIAAQRVELTDFENKSGAKPTQSAQRRSNTFSPNGIEPGQAGFGRLASSGLQIGKPFPSIKIVDADGKEFSTEQLKGHYTVLVAGCLTCPAFLGSYLGVEAVHRDYATKGVKFYYVYRALAHPENNGIIKPFSLKERLMHIGEARQRLKTQVPWLADNMNNDFKRTIGNTNNSEFVLDPEGRIVHMQMWSNGDRLRVALQEHVGPVAKPTTVTELGIPIFQMRPNTHGTVLPRIEVPGIMVPLKIEPKQNGQPFYVKLRAEAEQSVLEKGSGKIYLGFHIDPIHNTHWNNLAKPLHFDIKASSPTKVTPASGNAPKLKIESDSDPREFLISLENANPNAPLDLTVYYFACSDDPAWCNQVEQEYSIHLARDEFGGAVFGRTFVPGGPFRGGPSWEGQGQRGSGRPLSGFGGQRPQATRPNGAGPPNAEAIFSRFDRNSDGKLTENEVPAGLWQRLRNTDANNDGAITPEEFEKNRFRRPPTNPSKDERPGRQKRTN